MAQAGRHFCGPVAAFSRATDRRQFSARLEKFNREPFARLNASSWTRRRETGRTKRGPTDETGQDGERRSTSKGVSEEGRRMRVDEDEG